MQLGRLGESEALFTLFVGGSLLVWHAGYLQGARKHWYGRPAMRWPRWGL